MKRNVKSKHTSALYSYNTEPNLISTKGFKVCVVNVQYYILYFVFQIKSRFYNDILYFLNSRNQMI